MFLFVFLILLFFFLSLQLDSGFQSPIARAASASQWHACLRRGKICSDTRKCPESGCCPALGFSLCFWVIMRGDILSVPCWSWFLNYTNCCFSTHILFLIPSIRPSPVLSISHSNTAAILQNPEASAHTLRMNLRRLDSLFFSFVCLFV